MERAKTRNERRFMRRMNGATPIRPRNRHPPRNERRIKQRMEGRILIPSAVSLIPAMSAASSGECHLGLGESTFDPIGPAMNAARGDEQLSRNINQSPTAAYPR